jgi:lipopolysaccharide export system permease protein
MLRYPTLAKYLVILFWKQLLITSTIILSILFISNAFDILQKFKSVTISPRDFWLLVLYKVPYLFNEVSVMTCFITTLLFIQNLRKNNELIIMLSNGIAPWRIFLMPVMATFFFGIIVVTFINPMGVYGLTKYTKLEATVTGVTSGNFIISPTGAFFYEKYLGNNRIIHAKSIMVNSNTLNRVTVLVVDAQNNLIQQIDSAKAILESGTFILSEATIISHGRTSTVAKVELPTNLSIKKLILQFNPPQMIPLWNLKNSINKFLESGLAVTRYQLYYYKQLLKPLAMVALSLVACWFISLNTRDKSNSTTLVLALLVGIGSYFFLEIALRILAYSGFSPFLASLLPIIVIILISNFVILHFQEA